MSIKVSTNSRSAVYSQTFGGIPGQAYNVSFRVRGVCGAKTYTGGSTLATYVNVGGAPASDDADVLKLEIVSPPGTFYLNKGVSNVPAYNTAFDYSFSTTVNGGSLLTLVQDNQDFIQYRGDVNGSPIPVSGESTVDGCWMDVQYVSTDENSGVCSGTILTGADPVAFLNDYTGQQTGVRIERVAPMSADGGTISKFDSMLSTYSGGSINGTRVQTEFRIHGLPSGNYDVYVYTGGTLPVPTDIMVTSAGSSITSQNTPYSASDFVSGTNYSVSTVGVLTGGTIGLRTTGFLAGAQISRPS